MTGCILSEVKQEHLAEILWKQRCDMVDGGLGSCVMRRLSVGAMGGGLLRKRGGGARGGTGQRTPALPGRAPRWTSIRGDPLLFCEVLKCTGQGVPLKLKFHCFQTAFAGSSQEAGYGFLFLAW